MIINILAAGTSLTLTANRTRWRPNISSPASSSKTATVNHWSIKRLDHKTRHANNLSKSDKVIMVQMSGTVSEMDQTASDHLTRRVFGLKQVQPAKMICGGTDFIAMRFENYLQTVWQSFDCCSVVQGLTGLLASRLMSPLLFHRITTNHYNQHR